MVEKIIKISDVKTLLEEGKTIKVLTKNNQYTKILDYIDKGMKNTFKVSTIDGFNIKVSGEHKFYTNVGWVKCKDLIIDKHSILNENNEFSKLSEIKLIGKHKIVDITVDHKDQCYFGNGLLNHNSGKSLLAAHALSSTQKVGGVAILIDTENAISKDYLSAIGVNVDNLLYLQLETIEDIFDTIEKVIIKVRESNKNKPITIVVDSLAAATTKIEANANYDKDGYATDKAILLSKAYRKITNLIGKQHITLIVTNQLREKMGITWGDKFTASGGKATGFHASVRIRLKSVGKIKAMVNGVQRVVGISTVATVFKNRVGPPHAEAEFDIFFASGIDDYSGWLKKLIEYKVITGTAKKYKFVDKSSGEIFEFSSNQFIKLMADNIELRDTLYNILCDKIIMPYSTINQFGIDDVVIDMKDEE